MASLLKDFLLVPLEFILLGNSIFLWRVFAVFDRLRAKPFSRKLPVVLLPSVQLLSTQYYEWVEDLWWPNVGSTLRLSYRLHYQPKHAISPKNNPRRLRITHKQRKAVQRWFVVQSGSVLKLFGKKVYDAGEPLRCKFINYTRPLHYLHIFAY